MSTTYTPNAQLGMPAAGDRTWNVPLNDNCTTLDALAPVGGLNVTTSEVPSATLNVAVAPGAFVTQSGAVVGSAGASSTTLTASSTVVLYLDGTASWALAVASSYPSTAHVRLATVIVGSSTITTITDNRQAFSVCGFVQDGTTWALGSSSGLQIATASTQKLGFFGKTPAAQPTMGAATANSTYSTNEQTMLQAVYNAVRALGLGS
jgi:hypothetical protein